MFGIHASVATAWRLCMFCCCTDLVIIQNAAAGIQIRLVHNLHFRVGSKILNAAGILVDFDPMRRRLLPFSCPPKNVLLGWLDVWIILLENVQADPLSTAGIPLAFLVGLKC